MGPYKFYRVEDEDSRARFVDGEGIFAEDLNTRIEFDPDLVLRHLHWRNRVATPFISMYSDEDVAMREAIRRVEEGKEEVRVYTIDVRECDERREYRNLRRLAETRDFEIPKFAWKNSKYEYLWLHHVPDSAVTGCTCL